MCEYGCVINNKIVYGDGSMFPLSELSDRREVTDYSVSLGPNQDNSVLDIFECWIDRYAIRGDVLKKGIFVDFRKTTNSSGLLSIKGTKGNLESFFYDVHGKGGPTPRPILTLNSFVGGLK